MLMPQRNFGEDSMQTRVGSNQYQLKYKGLKLSVWYSIGIILLCIVIVGILGYLHEATWRDRMLSPLGKPMIIKVIKEVKAIDRNPIDAYIDEAALKFGKGRTGYSSLKKTLHCLLYYESKHGYATGRGDNGMAAGIFQFWEDTWIRMRKQMIKQGVAETISDRYDNRAAAFTAAWAITNGRGNEWGPLLRGECK